MCQHEPRSLALIEMDINQKRSDFCVALQDLALMFVDLDSLTDEILGVLAELPIDDVPFDLAESQPEPTDPDEYLENEA